MLSFITFYFLSSVSIFLHTTIWLMFCLFIYLWPLPCLSEGFSIQWICAEKHCILKRFLCSEVIRCLAQTHSSFSQKNICVSPRCKTLCGANTNWYWPTPRRCCCCFRFHIQRFQHFPTHANNGRQYVPGVRASWPGWGRDRWRETGDGLGSLKVIRTRCSPPSYRCTLLFHIRHWHTVGL